MTIRVFASHDWGTDGANHARVAGVVAQLRQRGLNVWFDDTHMRGNIVDAMCKGIDECDVVIVFLTKNYMRKVENGKDTDNVRREFHYAMTRPEKFVVVKFSRNLPETWTGPVGMILGGELYVDLTEVNEQSVDKLVDTIRHKSPRILWKGALHRAQHVSKVAPRKCQSGTRAIVLAPSPPSTPPAPTLRDRVDALYGRMGDQRNATEHIGVAVERLAVSLLGTVRAREEQTVLEKVARLERELGVAR